MEEMEGYRVIELIIENFKRIEAVQVRPSTNVIEISGNNTAGKTSFLDAMFWGMLGPKIMKELKEPVRQGFSEATVQITLGDGPDVEPIIIKRTITTDGKTNFTITTPTGKNIRNPATLMNKLMNTYTFDPAEFTKLSDKDQVSMLMRVVGKEEELNKLMEERKEAYDTRRLVNKDFKNKEGLLVNIPFVHHSIPDEPQSVSVLTAQLQEAEQIAATKSSIEADITYTNNTAQTAMQRIEDLKQRIAVEEQTIQDCKAHIQKQQSEFDKLEVPDTTEIQTQIEEVQKLNELVAAKNRRKEVESYIADLKRQSQEWTNKINDIDAMKAQIIADAQIPVPGLGFNEDHVTLNDIPLSQCSTREKIDTSARIVMATKPAVTVMRINDGSSLDSEYMRQLNEIAEEQGFQVWVERVDESGEVGIFMSEGLVAKDNYT